MTILWRGSESNRANRRYKAFARLLAFTIAGRRGVGYVLATMTDYPTEWQRRVLWTVFTYLAIVALGTVAAVLTVLFGRAVGFLQPVLIPFAVAAVLAFLLEPVISLMTTKTRLSRTLSVLIVFVLISLLMALLFVSVVPQIYSSSVHMVQDMPEYAQKAQTRLNDLLTASQKKIDQIDRMLPGAKAVDRAAARSASSEPTKAKTAGNTGTAGAAQTGNSSSDDNSLRSYFDQQLPQLQKQVPAILNSGWHLLIKSIGGFLGVFGAMLSAIIIPVYLYFLLVEGRNIGRWWSEYLPIRDSPFKQEVVSVLLEINVYLKAFFRGQLLVSSIDAVLIGGSLYFILHLDFAFFIGLLVLVLTFIPYLGIILCYIPALLIAVIQFGDWQHPFYAVLIMFIAQTLEGTIISPYIVGDAVGLHPMTVIISVFGWSLLLNGPIGAILAVPLSATVKVLLRRYVWEKGGRSGRHLVPVTPASLATLQKVAQETEAAKNRKEAEKVQAEVEAQAHAQAEAAQIQAATAAAAAEAAPSVTPAPGPTDI
jgi:predicted PurR-regulated permease PerM